jgi:hypothetical protein
MMPLDSLSRPRAASIPPAAAWVGYLGCVPFGLAAAALWVAGAPALQREIAFAMAAYGAVILSFLGGVRWGREIARQGPLPGRGPLLLSTAPCLLAWLALLLPGPSHPLLALLLAFVVVGLLDVHEEELAWYARLRLVLTAIVGACLVAALLAVAL